MSFLVMLQLAATTVSPYLQFHRVSCSNLDKDRCCSFLIPDLTLKKNDIRKPVETN